jgi:hypothetical protein
LKRTACTLAAVALAAILTGCGTAAHSSAASPATGTPVPAAPAASPPAATVGAGYTITDPSDGIKYAVTLTRVISPTDPDNEFDAADAGSHLVGLVFSVTGDSGTASDDATSRRQSTAATARFTRLHSPA